MNSSAYKPVPSTKANIRQCVKPHEYKLMSLLHFQPDTFFLKETDNFQICELFWANLNMNKGILQNFNVKRLRCYVPILEHWVNQVINFMHYT